MKLAEPLQPILALLREAYPGGLPDKDYPALLVVLQDVLSEENLASVVAEFADDERVVVANDAAAASSLYRPALEDVKRVRAVLYAHGMAGLESGL